MHHYIVQEELARARAPELVGRIGVNLIGPTILAHGTDEQKQRWLPSILPAEKLFCQLFSEPDAGSDLASLSTRAVPAEGGWRLSGQKVWTSYAQFADWGLCLARSHPDAPKHQGITAFMVDMHADGVDIRPLRQITDESDFNEVFLNDVFVAHDQVIGQPGNGWRVSQSTLTVERGTNPRQLVIHLQLLEELFRLAAETGRNKDPLIRQSLARAFIEVRLFQLQNWRVLSRLAHGRDHGPESATAKLFWSEMSQRLHNTAMDVLGPAASLGAGRPPQPRRGPLAAVMAVLSGSDDLRRNQRNPAQHHCGAHSRLTPGTPLGAPMSTAFDTIEYTVNGAVATITLNRPEVANAQDTQLIDELDAAFDLAGADDDVRVVVMAANGRHFSAGHDLKALVGDVEPDKWRLMRDTPEGKFHHEKTMYFDRCLKIRDFPKPTIAAVHGKCIAAGVMLACMCDLIVASDDASFQNPVLRMTGAAVEILIEPWEMPPRKAKEFLLTAQTLTAGRCRAHGHGQPGGAPRRAGRRRPRDGRRHRPGPPGHRRGGEAVHQQDAGADGPKGRLGLPLHGPPLDAQHRHRAGRAGAAHAEVVDEGSLRRAPG